MNFCWVLASPASLKPHSLYNSGIRCVDRQGRISRIARPPEFFAKCGLFGQTPRKQLLSETLLETYRSFDELACQLKSAVALLLGIQPCVLLDDFLGLPKAVVVARISSGVCEARAL